MVEELIHGYVLCNEVLCVGKEIFLSEETLSKVEGTNVLLFGTYWTKETVSALTVRAKSTTVIVYSETDFNRYYPMPAHCKHLHIETLLSKTHHKMHFWIKPLLNRTRPTGTEEDEQFYRGLLYLGKVNGKKDLESLIPALVRKELMFVRDHIYLTGQTIHNLQKMESEEIVERYSIELTLRGYRACLVVGGAQPVMPLVMAAASKEGVDIGVNVRFYANENVTRITFYTHKESVDMEFVHESPFNGGGRRECKGCTVKGWFANVEKLVKFMEATRI